jgi:hypothetical protein
VSTGLAGLTGLAVDGGQSTTALWVAIATLIGGIITAVVTGGFGLAGKRGEVRQTSDAGVRDDQREYISILRTDNKDLRERVATLEQGHIADQQRIAALEQALRDAGIRIPEQVVLPVEKADPHA